MDNNISVFYFFRTINKYTIKFEIGLEGLWDEDSEERNEKDFINCIIMAHGSWLMFDESSEMRNERRKKSRRN